MTAKARAIEIAARCWCATGVANRVMDPELCQVFAEALESFAAEARNEALEECAKVAEEAIQYKDCTLESHHPAWCSVCENGQEAGEVIAAQIRARGGK